MQPDVVRMLLAIIKQLCGYSAVLKVLAAAAHHFVQVVDLSLKFCDRIGGLVVVAKA